MFHFLATGLSATFYKGMEETVTVTVTVACASNFKN